MQRIKFVLFFLLSAALSRASVLPVSEQNNPPDQGGDPAEYSCNIPAPSDFHADVVGPDFANLVWVGSFPQPAQYHLKTYESLSNVLVNDITIPGWFNSARIPGLTAGTYYYSTITPICDNRQESLHQSVSPPFAPIVLDLIVTGFTGSNSNTIGCTTSYSNTSCPFASNYLRTFKIVNKVTQEERKFGIMQVSDQNFQSQIGSAGNNGQTFQFFCNEFTNPDCGQSKFYSIKYNGTTIFKYSLNKPTANSSIAYLICTYADPSSNYEVELIEETALWGGEDRNGQADNAASHGISVQPNPFTNTLDISLHTGGDSHIEISLFNSGAELVSKQVVAADQDMATINTAGLTPGVYYLKVASGTGTYTVKAIKTQ